MRSEVYDLLSSFGYPVFLSGTLNTDSGYPDAFFTFWNDTSDDKSFYDDQPTRAVMDYDVIFIAKNPALVEEISEQARLMLRSNGYVVSGKPTDVTVERPPYTGAEFTATKMAFY